MLSQEQLMELGVKIKLATSFVSTLATGMNPALIPFAVLGKALADMTPEIINSVQKIISREEPTTKEEAALQEKIKLLISSDPDSIK